MELDLQWNRTEHKVLLSKCLENHYLSLTEFMPLLDLAISVINNLVSNCMGMGLYIFYDDTKDVCKGYEYVIRPT